MTKRSLADRVILGTLIVFLANAALLNFIAVAGLLLKGSDQLLVGVLDVYAQWDPLYADPPRWLRFSLSWGSLVHGPYFAAALYAFWRRREWIRNFSLLYAGAATFEVIQYFVVEFGEPAPGTNLLAVTLFNLPWAVFPTAMAVRAWRAPMFAPGAVPVQTD